MPSEVDTLAFAQLVQQFGLKYDAVALLLQGKVITEICMSFADAPDIGETVTGYVTPSPLFFSANFAGSVARVRGGLPEAAFIMTVRKVSAAGDGVLGTITVGSSGAVTFATVGGTPVSLAAGDTLLVIGATSPRGISDFDWTLVGYPSP